MKKYHDKLYCFSPLAMLTTFTVEFILAVYTFWRYKINILSRLAITTLLALGTFQLSEYMLCGGIGLSNVSWARLGYVAITLLPALGIHILVTIAEKKAVWLVNAAYASCAMFVAFYLFATSSVSLHNCFPNYAVFSAYSAVSAPFGLYYYGWLLIGIYLAWTWGNELPSKQKSLQAMISGYLVFILPTTTANVINPATIAGIPSIMCGFAVLFALILSFKVLPSTCKVRDRV